MFDKVTAKLRQSAVTKVVNKVAMHHPAVLAIRAAANAVQTTTDDAKQDISKAQNVGHQIEESKDFVANRNLEHVDVNDAEALRQLGLFRLVFVDFDILFDEKGNIFGLKGKF